MDQGVAIVKHLSRQPHAVPLRARQRRPGCLLQVRNMRDSQAGTGKSRFLNGPSQCAPTFRWLRSLFQSNADYLRDLACVCTTVMGRPRSRCPESALWWTIKTTEKRQTCHGRFECSDADVFRFVPGRICPSWLRGFTSRASSCSE